MEITSTTHQLDTSDGKMEAYESRPKNGGARPGIIVLMEGGSDAMVTIQAGRLVPIPFAEMIDPQSGKICVRFVDIQSEGYQTLYEYMIRLKPEDFSDAKIVKKLARAGQLSASDFVERFGSLVRGVDANGEKQGTR